MAVIEAGQLASAPDLIDTLTLVLHGTYTAAIPGSMHWGEASVSVSVMTDVVRVFSKAWLPSSSDMTYVLSLKAKTLLKDGNAALARPYMVDTWPLRSISGVGVASGTVI